LELEEMGMGNGFGRGIPKDVDGEEERGFRLLYRGDEEKDGVGVGVG
jgi:hypothetical protein